MGGPQCPARPLPNLAHLSERGRAPETAFSQIEIRFIVGEQYRSGDVSRSELALRPPGHCAGVLCQGGGTFTEAIPAAVAA
jgi:hypothetical protein